MDTATQSSTSPQSAQPARHRGSVACRRCRRQRAKCIHEGARPPCRRCSLAGGATAASCSFPARGEKDTDRVYRNPRLGEKGGPKLGSPGTPDEALRPQTSLPTPSLASQGRHVTPLSTTRSPVSLSATPSPAPPPVRRLPAHMPPHTLPALPAKPAAPRPSYAGAATTARAANADAAAAPPDGDGWPPHCEVVEGCRTFVTCYFQLGFLPKAMFLEKLANQGSSPFMTSSAPASASPSASPSAFPPTISRFLLCCILSISSRFTPGLVQRYGSKAAATDYFLQLAQRMAPSEMYSPSLERVQAFFLLSIAEWGNGDRDRSAMDMGVAVRQAVVLQLHREETYSLPPPRSTGAGPAPADAVVHAESARRTFWMIHSQENLHSGTTSPAPVPLEDITALLPCNETDFAFGDLPATRAALAGTQAARDHPELVFLPSRCLFATLIQAHSLWGHVARHATPAGSSAGGSSVGSMPLDGLGADGSTCPWDEDSMFAQITTSLRVWEAELPVRHRWSLWNLRGWRAEGLHLAYLSVVMVLRLSNIVARRIYLAHLIEALCHGGAGAGANASAHSPTSTRNNHATPTSLIAEPPSAGRPDISTPAGEVRLPPPGFWQQVSHELFDNVVELHEQVVAYFSTRTQDEGFPAILVFCVYVCGSLASALWHNPGLCPHVPPAEAEDMAMSTLRILGELYQAWPVSARWQMVLRHIASSGGQGSEDDGSEEAVNQAVGAVAAPTAEAALSADVDMASDGPRLASDVDVSASSTATTESGEPSAGRGIPMEDFPNELFSAELAEYLEGSVHYGLLDGLYFKP